MKLDSASMLEDETIEDGIIQSEACFGKRTYSPPHHYCPSKVEKMYQISVFGAILD